MFSIVTNSAGPFDGINPSMVLEPVPDLKLWDKFLSKHFMVLEMEISSKNSWMFIKNKLIQQQFPIDNSHMTLSR